MVKIKVPATTANLGPGLDTLGMALSLYLTVELDFSRQGTIVDFSGDDKNELREHPEQNLVLQAAWLVLEQAGLKNPDLHLIINNEIPVGKGLGSSASAIVAGIYGANRLLGNRFSDEQLFSWAVKMEGHGDNIVPAIAGGFCAVMLQEEKVFYQKLPLPAGLKMVLAVPEFALATTKSRKVLPQQISLADAVSSLQRACFLIGSLANADYSQLALAMHDPVFQAVRKDFIPGFDQVILKAQEAGAQGVTISGAGPSVIAFTTNKETEIGEAMHQAFAESHINSQILILHPSAEGLVYLD